jgi:hypothetical protein
MKPQPAYTRKNFILDTIGAVFLAALVVIITIELFAL